MRDDVVAFIYARTDSRRLPKKVFMEVGGVPVIDIVYARAKRLNVGEVVVLTTSRRVDDELADYCNDQGYVCRRGETDDLVSRTVRAIKAYRPKIFVRINGDCPFFEPTLVNSALQRMLGTATVEMVSNVIERTFPYGISVECICSTVYLKSSELATDSEREHVTQHLYRISSDLSLVGMRDGTGNNSNRRMVLDTQNDLTSLNDMAKGRDVRLATYWELLGIEAPMPILESKVTR